MSSKEKIQELISNDRIDEAFTLLNEMAKEKNQVFKQDLTHLTARWNHLKKENMNGVISQSEHSIERAKIVYAMLNLLEDGYVSKDTYENNDTTNTANITGNGNVVIQGVTNSNINLGKKNEAKKIRILFLASNPTDTAKLELAEEYRCVALKLQESGNYDKFELYQEWAVTPDRLQHSILKIKPNIIHFSGHGKKEDPGMHRLFEELGINAGDGSGIVLNDENGKSYVITGKALGGLFKLFSSQKDFKIDIVVLNACFSDTQAKEISVHIPYVIGINSEILQDTATLFTTGFYLGLADGRDTEFSFQLGVNRVQMQNLGEEDSFMLYKKP